MKRRDFLKKSACVLSVLPACGLIVSANTAQAETIVSEDEATAKALGYSHDVSKVDSTKWPKKAEGQNCANCSFLQGAAKKIDGKAGEWIGCQIFPGKLVNVNGWCLSLIHI